MSSHPRSWMPRRQNLAAMVRLAVPVVTVQLGLMTMGVVDAVMVGHVSARALAAVGLGHMYFIATCSFGLGALMALDPLVAQAVGSGDRMAVERALQRGLLIAFGLSLPTALVLVPGAAILTLLGQPAEVVPLATAYAHISIPGVPAFFCFVVLRQTLQAMERVAPVVIIIVTANVANALLDWWLVYGGLGLPPMGALGSAWASTASRWLLALGVLVVARKELAPYLSRLARAVFELPPMLRMMRVGLPIGIQFQLEFVAFAVIAVLMGWLGTTEIAAHQVAISLAALTFMVPLGVASAAAVHVGHAVGREDEDGARRSAAAGLLCGVGFMTVSALVFLAFPGPLAALFTDVEAVQAIAVVLIPVAGFFQVFDGLQVVSCGILRGVGDTRAPMLINVLGFWLVGMPVSAWLSFGLGLGPTGLWWGLVAGLGSVALLLLARVVTRLRGGLSRLVVD